jgi:hypothetical protein
MGFLEGGGVTDGCPVASDDGGGGGKLLSDKASSPGYRPRFLAAEALEHGESAVETEPRGAAGDDESLQEIWMPDRDAESDDASKRLSEEDRPFEPQHSAEDPNVIDPGVQVPPRGGALVAPTLSAMIEKDQLRPPCQREEPLFEEGMVEARTAM